ncbi:MAG: Panacea domain-containing protein [Gemmatimonadota bacterium]
MGLIKLLYLADRASLVRWGRPITFDWYFSLPHGPVLSFTLDKINAEADPHAPSYWHRFISEREGHFVGLVAEPSNDQLSSAEEKILEEVFSQFGGMSQWELRDHCHRLPEWQDPHGSRLPIDMRDILLAEGLTEEEVEEILTELEAEVAAGSLLG